VIAFILWFVVLVGLLKFTHGWSRGILVALYLLGSFFVVL